MICHQDSCREEALYCYRWPGSPLAPICEACSRRAQQVAAALGLALDFLPIEVLERKELDRVARFELATALRQAAEALEHGESFHVVTESVLTNLAAWEQRT